VVSAAEASVEVAQAVAGKLYTNNKLYQLIKGCLKFIQVFLNQFFIVLIRTLSIYFLFLYELKFQFKKYKVPMFIY